MNGERYFMRSHIISDSNNPNDLDSTNKMGEKVPNVSEVEYTGLQYAVDIGAMFSASTLLQYENSKWNIE